MGFFSYFIRPKTPPNGTLELELGFQKYLVLYYKKVKTSKADKWQYIKWMETSKQIRQVCVKIVNVLEAMSLFAFKVKSCV